MDDKQLGSLKSQTVATTARPKSDFVMFTPAKAYGVVGGIVAVSHGNKLDAEFNLEDPASAIAEGLVRTLEAYQGVRPVTPAVPGVSNDVKPLAAAAKGKANLLIDVQTLGRMAIYYPTVWNRYKVVYQANALLIDVNTQSVIAQGSCNRSPDANDDSPSYGELWANDAAVVRQEFARAAQECVQKFVAQMFPAAKAAAVAASQPAVATPVPSMAAPTPAALSTAPAAAPTASTPTAAPIAPVVAAAPVTASPAAPVARAGATVSMPFVPDSKPVGRVAGPAPAAPLAAQSVPTIATVPVVSPAQPAPAATATAAAPMPASKKESRLQWLKQMRDANLITSGEYETKRQQVLSAP